MTKEEELKQHAIEFAGWLIKKDYKCSGEINGVLTFNLYTHTKPAKGSGLEGICSSGTVSSVQSINTVYQRFLDSNLSDVEKFRNGLLKEISDNFMETFRWGDKAEHCEAITTTRKIVDIIKDFKLP